MVRAEDAQARVVAVVEQDHAVGVVLKVFLRGTPEFGGFADIVEVATVVTYTSREPTGGCIGLAGI